MWTLSKPIGLLLVLLAISQFGQVAQAKYGGGSGTADDPYQIWTAQQMNTIGAEPNDWDKHFKLMGDIDLSAYTGTAFYIIGTPDRPFTGVFDGNGKKISNFARTSAGTKYIGLFGHVSGKNALIKNLGLIAPNVDGGTDNCVGPIVGFLKDGNITGCYVQGGSVEGALAVGGLVGSNAGAITNCYSSASVKADKYVGGLVGYNNATITNCYSTGTVEGAENVGGLVGSNAGAITNCYSSASVKADKYVGGLVGYNNATITNCYSTGTVEGAENVGGLVGSGSAVNSLWDIETSGQTASGGGTGKTTTEMQTADTFFAWGICGNEGVWTIDEGKDYPRLRWENKPGKPIEASLSEYLTGEGTQDSPYLIYTLQDFDAIARFPCEHDKHFRLMFFTGEGTQGNPYLIYTADELNTLGMCPYGLYAHFKLMADIDLSGFDGEDARPVFNIIGPTYNNPFAGVFDGNGHTISHLTIQGGEYLGLFGRLASGAEVKNLGVVDVNIIGGGYVGGLVGDNRGAVTQCYSTGAVNGALYVGGLVAYNGGAVTNCYSTGAVNGAFYVGGLVGSNSGNVTQCYSTAAVTGGSDVGGLVGYRYYRSVTGCFWDTQTSGQATSAGGTGKTTAEMHMASTFLAWGCAPAVWTIDEGVDYPRLAWEGKPGKALPALADFLAGYGGQGNPYLIWTGDDLNMIGVFPCDWDKHFKLMADIDLSAFDGKEGRPAFNMIAPDTNPSDEYSEFQGTPFTGVFDGNGHTISHLTITGGGCLGLFGYLGSGAEVRNLAVVDVNITGSGRYVGGLVGWNFYGDVTGCYSTGLVSGNRYVGGLVGLNSGSVTRCYSTGTVSGASYVGGLVGYNYYGSTYYGSIAVYNYYGSITTSYSTGTVSGTGQFSSSVGGLVGENRGLVAHCYSTGVVSGNLFVGGLAGENSSGENSYRSIGVSKYYGSITSSYSTGMVTGTLLVGGLVGVDNMCGRDGTCFRAWNVTQCFWDVQTSGQPGSIGGTGLTTAEMQTASTFLQAGWDFVGETIKGTEDIWGILEGKDYPRLAWEFRAFSPDPSNGAIKFIQCPALIWVAARGALAHDIYFGENLGVVADATSQTQAIYRGRQAAEMTRYDPGILELDKTYYWRIDEVNEADPNSPWKGSVWSFTTVDYIVTSVVDDIESYTEDVDKRVFQTWKDGRGYTNPPPGYPGNGTGSIVGYTDTPYAEQVIVHSGRQSMPMKYNNVNKPWHSEAERTWETPQDWTVGGADTLTLHFRGWADNGRQPLYVGIEDSAGQIAVVAHPDADVLLATEWQKWHIALADLKAAGVNVAAVKKMVIGVGDRKNPQPGGTGTIYIDDIRLTYRNFVVGDFDGDGHRDFRDFCIFAEHWLTADGSFWCGQGCDLTNDNKVDFSDLRYLAQNWLGHIGP